MLPLLFFIFFFGWSGAQEYPSIIDRREWRDLSAAEQQQFVKGVHLVKRKYPLQGNLSIYGLNLRILIH
jgi:hypothetical protein